MVKLARSLAPADVRMDVQVPEVIWWGGRCALCAASTNGLSDIRRGILVTADAHDISLHTSADVGGRVATVGVHQFHHHFETSCNVLRS
jgi:hypothetical protein